MKLQLLYFLVLLTIMQQTGTADGQLETSTENMPSSTSAFGTISSNSQISTATYSNFSYNSNETGILPMIANINDDVINVSTTTIIQSTQTEEYPYEQGPFSLAAWTIVYFVMVIIAIVGNIGICVIIFSSKRMRTVTNLFLANTAVADSMVVLFNTVFNFTYAIHNRWYFGRAFCHFINFIPIAAVCASILTVTVISLDRFVIIMYPFKARISHAKAKTIIAFVWLVSLAVAFPQSYYATLITIEAESRDICLVAFPNLKIKIAYQLTFIAISYGIPLSVLAVTYVIMGSKLWGSGQVVGEMNDSMIRKIKNNKRAVRMMALVVVSFGICWLPYHTFFIVSILRPEISNWNPIQHVYLAIFWLAMSSTMYNPFIYCWVNARFRRAFWRLLAKKCIVSRSYTGDSTQPSMYYSTATNQTMVTNQRGRRTSSDLDSDSNSEEQEGRYHRHSQPNYNATYASKRIHPNNNLLLKVHETTP